MQKRFQIDKYKNYSQQLTADKLLKIILFYILLLLVIIYNYF